MNFRHNNNTSSTLRRIYLGCLVGLLAFGQPTYGSDKYGSDKIEEVLVTAKRKEQSASDISISINTFSGDQLKALGVVDTSDLSRAVPGFTAANSGFNIPIFTIRGVGLNETSQTASSTVAIYIDEANLPYPAMARGANLDIERVEVLKGPQGTLFGRNTTGGVVNYLPKKPTQETDFGVSASYARFDKYTLEGFASGNLFDGVNTRLAYRESRAHEGWQKSLTRPGDTLGEEKRQSGRFITEWTATETLMISLSSDWWKDESDSQAAQAIGFEPQNKRNADLVGDEAALHPSVRNHPLVPRDSDDMRIAGWPPDRKWQLDDDFLMGTLKVTWDITSGITLHYLGSYQDYDSNGSNLTTTGLSVENGEYTLFVDIEAYSNELRTSGVLFESIDWTIGVFSSRDEVSEKRVLHNDTNSNTILVPGADRNMTSEATTQIGDQSSKSDAVFVNGEWAPVHYLNFSLGARYTEELRKFAGCSFETPNSRGPGQPGSTPLFNAISLSQGGSGDAEVGECFTLDENGDPNLVRRELDENNISGRFTIDWLPNDDLLFYASYARGFKSGGFPTPPGATAEQFVPATQEKLNAIEAGGKLFLFNRTVQLNFAGFHYDYKDKQLLSNIIDPVFGALPALANIPESVVKGGELDLQYVPVEGLRLSFLASYVETEIKEFVGIDERGDPQNFAGNSFNFTPNLEYIFLVNYSIPVSRVFDIDSQFNIDMGADYSFSDDTNAELSENPDFAIDDYSLVNYRAGISSPEENWSLMFWGKNVTNEFYVSNVVARGDTIARFTGRPQTYGLTFEWSFK